MTGKQIEVVAAGGIFDGELSICYDVKGYDGAHFDIIGRGLASALCHGASAVWVGTRFVCAEESGAPRAHKEAILKASHESIVKTTIFVSP
jgi:NAD(P)H-dependent flavin oxidoreductase YrpB (nitropropane dioxygenase family)